MLEAIRDRFSCRSYTGEPVSQEDLRTVLAAGFCAPSAHNSRPWHFVVATDQEARQKLSKTHQWSRMCAQAPVVIAVCADRAKDPDWWVDDSAAAIENMLVQAQALGLGTVWIGIYAAEGRADYVRGVLDIPQEVEVVGLVAMGYPAQSPGEREDRYDEECVHWGKW
ncbi:MAG: nitroreductase family protein [Armatimonadota bacterium]